MANQLKISELIERLTALKELHGDLPVWGCVDDISCNGPDEVKRVEFGEFGFYGEKKSGVIIE